VDDLKSGARRRHNSGRGTGEKKESIFEQSVSLGEGKVERRKRT
jgi:hypothetical protein